MAGRLDWPVVAVRTTPPEVQESQAKPHHRQSREPQAKREQRGLVLALVLQARAAPVVPAVWAGTVARVA